MSNLSYLPLIIVAALIRIRVKQIKLKQLHICLSYEQCYVYSASLNIRLTDIHNVI